MSFTPITKPWSMGMVRYKTVWRNHNREKEWGIPVYYTPYNLALNSPVNGYGGPHYKSGYNYTNSPETAKGNCTWWCAGRLMDALGVNIGPGMGNGKDWYDNYSGSKDTDATGIQAGDIICFSGGSYGHVMFVEQVIGDTIYISESAWSDRDCWNGYACRVTTYTKAEISRGLTVDMYKDIDDTPYNVKVIGVIHTGEAGPEPPEPTTTLEITISPASYNKTMESNEDYLYFPFDIQITGIPEGETVSGGNTYPDLYRSANSGWTYTDYQVGGVTYRYATKSQTLRYTREYDWAYTTTKYMYFNITKSTGTISTTTPMYITVKKKSGLNSLLGWLTKRRKRGTMYVVN